MFEWSEYNITEFVRLHGEGLSFSAIGSELGCSRNAAIGKAHRMKLEKRTMGAQPRAERKPRRSTRFFKPRVQRFREVMPVPIEPLPDIAITASPTSACTILELSAVTCRWPLWTDAAPERLYCGAASAGTYCQHHTRMAWRHR